MRYSTHPGRDRWRVGAWTVVGEMVPFKQWPELRAAVTKETLDLQMGGPFSLAPSRVIDLRAEDLGRRTWGATRFSSA